MTGTPFNTSWTLRIDRDGTEDVAIILNADGAELVRSRPFWLPEGDSPVPPVLAAVRLMAAAPKLHRALDDLLEQTVEMDLKHGIALSEGEDDARTQARAALADACGAAPEPHKSFRVEVVVRTREVYRVAAATADEAEEDWWDGQLLDTDDSLETEILSVEEVQDNPPGVANRVVDHDSREEPETPAGPVPSPLPPDPEGMNDARADWAARAVTSFQDATGTDDEDVLCDLLADLMHWADRRRYDFAAALFRSRDHYDAETQGEEP